jgi:hypothetical protein
MCVFNHLRQTCYIPDHFKKGIRIPVFKGGNKDKLNKDDYRGITLLPTISKLYEMTLMDRAENWFLQKMDDMQGAGRKGGSCIQTSMILRERVSQNLERGSDVYVVSLDTRKAFDTVWVDGLFYQLHLLGMDNRLWWILRNYYRDVKCTVMVDGVQSRWFNISQGVHQGALSSMKLYIMFINSLLVELHDFGHGCHLSGIYCASPSLADDVNLTVLYAKSMQSMLDITFSHSCKWRYSHQVTKCVFTIASKHRKVAVCELTLGGDNIPYVKAISHMGIGMQRRGSEEAHNHTEARGARAKRAFYPILGLTRSGHQVNPVIASKLYWDVCASSMLYGIEV